MNDQVDFGMRSTSSSPAPAFSVVVPTYNRPDLLREAVASVVAQTVSDWECIVIDDGGELPLPEFVDPRVHVVRHDANGGVAAALNTGARLARGRYLAVLADDDLWTPDRLQLALDGLEHAPLALCWSQFLDEPGSESGRELFGDVSGSILDSTASMINVAIDREHWLPLRTDYRTCEDLEWWLRTAQTTPVHTIGTVGYLVRRHDGVRHLSGVESRFEDSKRLVEENQTWFDRHPNALAFRLRRIGHYGSMLGRRREAIGALRRSIRLRPTPGTAKQLALACLGRPAPGPQHR